MTESKARLGASLEDDCLCLTLGGVAFRRVKLEQDWCLQIAQLLNPIRGLPHLYTALGDDGLLFWLETESEHPRGFACPRMMANF